MTLGEKIRSSRKSCGLSQEQLAEKMCVSRSAIAKWETDKGMPDVENLKILSRLLQVSVDSLLDDGDGDAGVICRQYQLAAYGRGCRKVKKDRMMRSQFPGAAIFHLLGRPELHRQTPQGDSAQGIVTPDPFGKPVRINSIRELDLDFYLVEEDGRQFFVTVTDICLEIRPMDPPQTEKNFRLGGWAFVRCEALGAEAVP